MKKLLLPICLLAALLSGCQTEKKEEPYNRDTTRSAYERNFRNRVFAACQDPGMFYATYSLARVNAKPTECNPNYKVTFINGPCKGKTIRTTDVIEKTAPAEESNLVKGTVVLRDFWNPRTRSTDIDDLNRWNRAVVYDTSRLKEGVVELEFPRDRNDFMAAREFIYLQNVRTVQKPEQKDMRIWL